MSGIFRCSLALRSSILQRRWRALFELPIAFSRGRPSLSHAREIPVHPPPYSSCRISYRGLFSACKITATAQNNVIRLLCRVRRAKRAEFFIRRGVYFVLVHVSHLVGSTACGSTGNGLRDAETVLIFYPTYERCVFRMVSSCSLFSPFSSI